MEFPKVNIYDRVRETRVEFLNILLVPVLHFIN